METQVEKTYESRPWQYTDDIVGSIVILYYLVALAINLPTYPEWVLSMALGWLFGKGMGRVTK